MTLLLALLSGVIGCTNLKDAQPPAAHPLLGKIWDVKRGAEISKDALLREAGTAQYLLLGEVHDNPEHHRHQAEVLRALIAQGRRPALAMEQFDREYQPAIDAVLAQSGDASESGAEAIAEAGKFDRKGWDWPLYEPLLAIAAQARLPIVAINLSRNRTRDVARQGFASLGEGAIARLGLDANDWSPAQQAIEAHEIDDGHCGQLPPSAMTRMIDVQRARDGTMADAIVSKGADKAAVVIAGDGHARNDVGVPFYLARRAPGKRVMSIGLVEVDPDQRTVSEYVRPPAKALPFDYVWFTSATEREDPCAGLVMPARP